MTERLSRSPSLRITRRERLRQDERNGYRGTRGCQAVLEKLLAGPDGAGRLTCPVPLMRYYIEAERSLEVGLAEDLADLREGFSTVSPPA